MGGLARTSEGGDIVEGITDDLRRNAILASLPEREFEGLLPELEVMDAEIRHLVYEPGTPITDVYFPLSSVYSLVAVADDQEAVVEVATIGPEGMVGLPVYLGAGTSPHAAYCQVAGTAARLTATGLRQALSRDGALHTALNRLVQATMVQIAQNVVCNNSHSVEQRAARWLLTTHDRVAGDEFGLTQQFLAQMLGVRRATVSHVAGGLQSRGLISYRRGVVSILDRAGLEALACECYFTVKAEFDALTSGN